MKKNFYLLVLLLGLVAPSAYAQQAPTRKAGSLPAGGVYTSFENPAADSLLSFVRVEHIRNQALSRSGEHSLLLSGKLGKAYFTLSRLIPVAANEQVDIQAYVSYTKEPRKGAKLLPIAGAAPIGGYGPAPGSPAPAEATTTRPSRKLFPYAGIGLTLSPGMLKHLRGLPKAYLQYIVYDADTVRIKSGAKSIDKSALDNWQDLSISTTIPTNGFLQVVFINESEQPVRADDFSVRIAEAKAAKEKAYKGAIANHLNLKDTGGCVNVCGHTESTFLYSTGTANVYQVCYYTIDCSTGAIQSGWSCEEVTEPTSGSGDPGSGGDPSGGGSNPGGGSPPIVDCNGVVGGTASLDFCGVCVGGNTGRRSEFYYRDADNDGWGDDKVVKYCYNPGSGWVSRGGDYDDKCNDPTNDEFQCVSIRLTATNRIVSLLNSYYLQVTATNPTTGRVVVPDTYLYEIARQGTGSWVQLYSGPASLLTETAKVPGFWDIRVKALKNGKEYAVNTVTVEIQFPSFDEITNNAQARQEFDAMWQDTKNAASRSSRMELGGFVYLDTNTGRYSISRILGAVVPCGQSSSTPSPGVPSENQAASPLGTGKWAVAVFHTHTPLTYCEPITRRDPVGAIAPGDTRADMPSIVYDYVALYDPITRKDTGIFGGHNINSPAQLTGRDVSPTRRPTPF